MSHRCNNKPINLHEFTVPQFPAEKHQLKRCFEEGAEAAMNHYYGEDTEDLPYGIKTFSTYPYQVTRMEAYHTWMAGFYDQWGKLVREFGLPEDIEL